MCLLCLVGSLPQSGIIHVWFPGWMWGSLGMKFVFNLGKDCELHINSCRMCLTHGQLQSVTHLKSQESHPSTSHSGCWCPNCTRCSWYFCCQVAVRESVRRWLVTCSYQVIPPPPCFILKYFPDEDSLVMSVLGVFFVVVFFPLLHSSGISGVVSHLPEKKCTKKNVPFD